jgi:signal transduction histidine kinase
VKFSLQLKDKALILVAVPLLFELVFVASLTILLRQAETETLRESHSKLILAESNGVLRNFIDAGMALYMYQLSDSQTFLERFRDLSENIPEKIKTLRVMLRDSPNQAEALDRVERVSNAGLKILGQASMLISEGQSVSQLSNSRQELNNMIQELMSEVQRFSKEQEKAEHVNPEAAAQAKELVVRWLAVGIMVNIVIAVILALYFNKTTTRRLEVLMDNTDHLARGETLSPFVDGADEIAKLDKVFHRMADALIDASRRKQELMAMVAHDLRTPLTSIRASLSLMSMGAMGEMPDKAKCQIDGAEKNTRQLINLINDLLDIEKMEAGKMEMRFSDCVLQEIFDEAADAVREFAKNAKVEIDVEETPITLQADQERMVRVLINLLGNAVKFSPAESRVKLTGALKDNRLEVRVTDQGRGIPEDFKDKIFVRFQQVNPQDKQEKQGTGLGLAICKAIVEGHNGEIGVDSEVGKGSSFWLLIPIRQSKENA